MSSSLKLPPISEAEASPLVLQLLVIIEQLQAENQQLREEIARLKKHQGKPKIPPSLLNTNPDHADQSQGDSEKKRPGSHKRHKTEHLKIHETIQIAPRKIPEGSTFKGYKEYVVQDLEIKTHNTLYRLERWETPEGGYCCGELPESVQSRHFGPTLVSYVLYQYHQCHVTQPLLLEKLREWGIEISSGQLNHLLTEDQDTFHEEKQDLLSVALQVSTYVNVDDTGARHLGKNHYCTQMGNEFFTWFETTSSKSRLNFLELLRTGHVDYVLNEAALDYMQAQGFPKALLPRFQNQTPQAFSNWAQWRHHLNELQITGSRHCQIATEGALLGSVLAHGVSQSLVIVSDDAGQFKILQHALCWIHAERTIHKIIPSSEKQSAALQKVRAQIWSFYQELKAYKAAPLAAKKQELESRFDEIFTTKTCDATLNLALKRLHANKAELLLVLERPEIPLHNNLSERDIREYVKRRKISGSTRSELGKKARDTFTSLKKTCRKLKISFWEYLVDRVSMTHSIPPLDELVKRQAASGV